MRAEERHELRENSLSNWLQFGAWAFLKQNGSYILLIAALCFLGYRIYEYYQQKHAFEELAAYQDLDTAIRNESDRISNMPFDSSLSASALESAAKTDADGGMLPQAAAKYRLAAQKYQQNYEKAAANSAERRTAQSDLNRVSEQFMLVMQKETDRILQGIQSIVETSPVKQVQARAALELGRLYSEYAAKRDYSASTRPENLSKSYEYYSRALQLRGDDPLIAAKAHLGIAAVYEDQGEWDKAKAEYQIVIDGPQFAGPLADLAKDRQSSLAERKEAPRLAAWTPPKAVAPSPTPGIGGSPLPNVDLNMPESGLISPTSPRVPLTIGPMLGTPSSLGGTTPPTSAPAFPLLPLPPETQPK